MTKGKKTMLKVVDVLLDNLLDGAEIKWGVSYEPDLQNQRDAAFYHNEGRIATISYKGFEVEIFCDGEMRCYNTETEKTYRQTIHLLDDGINTDKDLSEANEKGILNWDMNCWFDAYVYGEHLDDVQYDLAEAIASAVTYVKDQHAEAEALMTCIDTLE